MQQDRMAKFVQPREARPVLRLPASPGGVVLDVLSLLMIVATVAVVVANWKELPRTVPIHFGFSGDPDRWGNRHVLWILPAMSAVLFAGLTVVARLPHRFNYFVPITVENAERQYRIPLALLHWVKAEVAALFLVLTIQTVRVALGIGPRIESWPMIVILALILVTAGIYVAKAIRAR